MKHVYGTKEQFIKYQTSLVELAKVSNYELDKSLKVITEADSYALGIERVSVWLFNEDHSEMCCKDLYQMSEDCHTNGLRLNSRDYPGYFRALQKNRILVANNARADRRASECIEGYLRPFGVTSLMDVPIRLHGKIVGIICHEHTGNMRSWTAEEQKFASSIADIASLALESSEQKQLDETLRKAHEELRIRVQKGNSDLSTAKKALQAEVNARKRVKDKLKRRNKDLGVLNTISRALHRLLDVNEIYERAVELTTRIENVHMAAIYIVDDSRGEAILRASKNAPRNYARKAGRIPYPEGITWKLIESGEIMNVGGGLRHPEIDRSFGKRGHHGLLGIPITLEEAVVGAIWFVSNKEKGFKKEEIDLLSAIGGQIAIAIARARLHGELSKKNRYGTIISTVMRSVHQSINPQEVLENSVEAMSRNIDGADNVGIWFVEGTEAVLKSFRGYPEWFVRRLGRIPYPKGTTWMTIMESKPTYSSDAKKDNLIGYAGIELGTKSYLSMPIRCEEKTIGVIEINSLRENAFDEEELKLLAIVAQQIGVAINNAQIAEALREREERYRVLYEENPAMYFTVDAGGTILSVNKYGAEQLGYTVTELIGRSILTVFNEDDKREVEKQLAKCLRNPRGNHQWHFRKVRKDGSLLWVREVARALVNDDGRVVVLIVCDDITDRIQSEVKLRQYATRLRRLSRNMMEVQETERRHIARELHDEIGQVLTAVKINLQAMRGLARNIRYKARLDEGIVSVDRALEQVRNLSLDLRPSMLDDLGLVASLRWYVDRHSQRAGLEAELVFDPLEMHLPTYLETVCFRIVQEALTNIVRHAQAQRVKVELRRRSRALELLVQDDGIGFDVRVAKKRAKKGAGFGLLGMQERALLVGGDLKIKSTTKNGTTVRAHLPITSPLTRKKRVTRNDIQ